MRVTFVGPVCFVGKNMGEDIVSLILLDGFIQIWQPHHDNIYTLWKQ